MTTLKKAHKENKITGQIGEKLAYQYFMNLIEKNISDKIYKNNLLIQLIHLWVNCTDMDMT